ncbi:MAG: chemotaxis protein CheA [Deltaproteobacteria bacterium]|nr:chemotaxis protein CheA [Deltaproteobacteria bacterium]
MEEYKKKVEEILDKLAIDLVMLDPQATEKLAAVQGFFDELVGAIEGAAPKPLCDFAHGLHALAERMASGEYPDPDQGCKQLADGISLFQECLRDADDVDAYADRISDFLERCGLCGKTSVTQEIESPEDDREDKPAMDILQDKELVESFVTESLEHLETIEVNVLSLEQDPQNIEVMNAIFRPFHTIKGVAGFLNLADINRLAHEVETLLDDARSEKVIVDETVTDLILDAVDLMKSMINHLRQAVESGMYEEGDFGLEAFLDRLRRVQAGESESACQEIDHTPRADGADVGDILINKGVVSEEDVAQALEKQSNTGQKLGEILIEEKKTTARDVAGALRDQRKLRGDAPVTQKKQELAAVVKVDTKKLDNMVDMVGELVITQAMLSQDISMLAAQDKRLYSNLSQLGRITSEIQRISMSLRMVPIKQTFHKMIRLVRDLSKKSGKLAVLEMVGEDTEIDRNMVDEIYDPLVHMVRNSVDHGIEAPEDRRAAGKPETGTLTLKAYHKGGNIVIEISEDGKGLDRDRIIQRAIERDLISSGQDLSDQDVYNLIFQPGFSTAEKVTDVSGRGVGMDVVKRAVEKMRGKIEIQSEKGEGTTVLMKLPLTMAIIDGMTVRAGDRDFIIPTMSVVESVRPERSAYTSVANQGEMIRIRDNLYPLIRLHEIFDFEPRHKAPWEAIVVVAESDGRRKCLLVDDLVGKQEVVIKSLGEHLKNVKGMAGGAILADGRVGLILDVAGLFEMGEGSVVRG